MNIQIIRSNRKTLSIQIRPDGTVIARAPQRMPEKTIQSFIAQKAEWIQHHLEKVASDNLQAKTAPLSQSDIHALADQAKQLIPERVQFYAAQMGVTYGRITIRNQVSRWGSCSSKGNLNFNCLLMLAPPEVLDYVVVHELSHRKHMNHSAEFWSTVASVLPEYPAQRKWLKENGNSLIARMQQQ